MRLVSWLVRVLVKLRVEEGLMVFSGETRSLNLFECAEGWACIGACFI